MAAMTWTAPNGAVYDFDAQTVTRPNGRVRDFGDDDRVWAERMRPWLQRTRAAADARAALASGTADLVAAKATADGLAVSGSTVEVRDLAGVVALLCTEAIYQRQVAAGTD